MRVVTSRALLPGAMLVLAAFAGCLSADAPVESAAVDGNAASESAGVASAGANASAILAETAYEGMFTVLVLGVTFPNDPITFPTEFPAGYGTALVEMAWTPAAPTNDPLSLMVHTADAAGNDGMLADVGGDSPLSLELSSATLPPDTYDVVAYIPVDNPARVVANQPFEIRVTFFDGAVPEGFSSFAPSQGS